MCNLQHALTVFFLISCPSSLPLSFFVVAFFHLTIYFPILLFPNSSFSFSLLSSSYLLFVIPFSISLVNISYNSATQHSYTSQSSFSTLPLSLSFFLLFPFSHSICSCLFPFSSLSLTFSPFSYTRHICMNSHISLIRITHSYTLSSLSYIHILL